LAVVVAAGVPDDASVIAQRAITVRLSADSGRQADIFTLEAVELQAAAVIYVAMQH
jgi:hypothetical protein